MNCTFAVEDDVLAQLVQLILLIGSEVEGVDEIGEKKLYISE